MVVQGDNYWIQVMLTNRCNMQCRLCNICREKDKFTVDLPMVKRLLAGLLKHGKSLECFSMTGGEPFLELEVILKLCPWLFRLMRGGRLGELNFNTNGTLTKNMLAFAACVPKDLVSRVSLNVSLDGMEDTHNSLRGGVCFHQTLKSMMAMQEKGFAITANFVISPHSFRDIYKVYVLSKKMNFEMEYNVFVQDARSFYHYSKGINVPEARTLEWRKGAVQQLDRILDDGAKTCRANQLRYIRESFVTGRIPKDLTRQCQRPQKIFFIHSSGEIFSCFYAPPLAHAQTWTWDGLMAARSKLCSTIRERGCRGCLLGSLKYVQC